MTIDIGELWKKLDTDIVRKAGIFPFNKDIIPREQFDKLSLERWKNHQNWKLFNLQHLK